MDASNIIVIKLGGSLIGSRHLAGWVDVLAKCGGRAILVPGGGPFADSVRQTQAKMGFDDSAAHHLALLAMEQFGWALASLKSSFTIANSRTAIRRALRIGDVPIWLPTKMVLAAQGILPSWDITSDSLAAWLAGQVGAQQVVLVKHGGPFGDCVQTADLVARGIVDRAFPRFLEASGVTGRIVTADSYTLAQKAFNNGTELGTPIDLHHTGAKRLLGPLWPRSKSPAGDGR